MANMMEKDGTGQLKSEKRLALVKRGTQILLKYCPHFLAQDSILPHNTYILFCIIRQEEMVKQWGKG